MNIVDKVKKEVEDLIEIGKRIVARASGAGNNLGTDDILTVTRWLARSGQLLQRLYEDSSYHRQMFDDVFGKHDFTTMYNKYYKHLTQVLGVLQSVKHELENNLLVNIRRLLQADIFADFLEMAEYLLDEGYKDAAAVLIGGVLEDSLRQLAKSRGIAVVNDNGKPLTLEPLNVELAKADTYKKLVKKQITSWANLRNDAAHGHYDKYDFKQGEMMLIFVQEFTSKICDRIHHTMH